MIFDPVMFGEDTGERREYARMLRVNSRPQKEARPMYIDADGKLQYKYSSNALDPHQSRMQAIFASKSVDGRSSAGRSPRGIHNGVNFNGHN